MEQRRERTDRAALMAELVEAGATVKGNEIKCPFHQDRHPSGSVYRGEDGVWRYRCHTAACDFCGDLYDVRARRRGENVAVVLQETRSEPKGHQEPPEEQTRRYGSLEAVKRGIQGVEATYHYDRGDGSACMAVFRYRDTGGRKRFLQARPEGGDGWVMKGGHKPWPLFNLRNLSRADEVVVVEGEKDVIALYGLGFTATTSAAGAGKAAHTDWSPLAGKRVWLWPDRDEVGHAHMEQVSHILDGLDPAPTVYWVDPAGLELPEGGDASDLIARLADRDTARGVVQMLLDDAEPMGASRDVLEVLEDTISGKRRNIPWPWSHLTRCTRALLPGTVTLLCGDPGATKSFVLLEAAAHWHEDCAEKIAVFELEEDRAYHLYRALAQRVADSRLLDDEWVAEYPDQVRALWAEHRDWMDEFGRCIYQAPRTQPSLDDLAAWVEDRAKAGCRVIAIDPVTAAQATDKPWVADLKFLMRVKGVVRDHGASLVLVTHPKQDRGRGPASLTKLAGSSAYERFAQTVLWIERMKEPEQVKCRQPHTTVSAEINRRIVVCKARNAGGAGYSIGAYWSGQTFGMQDFGVIVGKGEES